MFTNLLGVTYACGVGLIAANFMRTKQINDFDDELRNLREYDTSWETINKEAITTTQTKMRKSPKDMVILLAQVPKEEELEEQKVRIQKAKLKQDSEENLIFSRVNSYSILLDPVKHFEHKFSRKDKFTLTINNAKQEHPIEIQFNSGNATTFFDMETIGDQSPTYSKMSAADRLKKFYF